MTRFYEITKVCNEHSFEHKYMMGKVKSDMDMVVIYGQFVYPAFYEKPLTLEIYGLIDPMRFVPLFYDEKIPRPIKRKLALYERKDYIAIDRRWNVFIVNIPSIGLQKTFCGFDFLKQEGVTFDSYFRKAGY